jgi:hypothetical protein
MRNAVKQGMNSFPCISLEKSTALEYGVFDGLSGAITHRIYC